MRGLISVFLSVAVALLLLSGCRTVDTRIAEHAAEFNALDASTRQKIRRGLVEPGYTMTMVYIARGRPAETTTLPNGDVQWVYREHPVTAYNETITDGFRRRYVFDPLKRGYDVIVEPIDTKAFPHLVPHSLHLTFHDGKLVAMERTDRM